MNQYVSNAAATVGGIQALKPWGSSRRCLRLATLQLIMAPAATGPKACKLIEPVKSPVRAAAVARVRKQVGQGTPVNARSGQAQPGRAGCRPFSQRVPVRTDGSTYPALLIRHRNRFRISAVDGTHDHVDGPEDGHDVGHLVSLEDVGKDLQVVAVGSADLEAPGGDVVVAL